jgi:hypothetical protein
MKNRIIFLGISLLILAIIIFNLSTRNKIVEGHGMGGRGLGHAGLGLGGYGLYRGYGGTYYYGGGDGVNRNSYFGDYYYPYAYPQVFYDEYGNPILVSSYNNYLWS